MGAENGKQIMKIKNNLQTTDGTDVSLSIKAVADSMLTEGPFKSIFTKLLSPVYDITPSSTVEGSMEMNFPILDEAANDTQICKNLLKLTTVWSYSSGSTSDSAKPEDKPCDQGDPMVDFPCVCKMSINHFSYYSAGP